MTSKERFQRMYEHREADRIPITDYAWPVTVERWQQEGMPTDMDYADYFGLDKTAQIHADNSPRFDAKTLEENDEYRIYTTPWGATLKKWKHVASTPDFVDFTVTDRDQWEKAKAQMTPTRDRINWAHLKENYPRWREEGRWIQAGLWFGFDTTHSWFIGTERMLIALIEYPDWCRDMFSHELETNLALLDMVWEAGYEFDCVGWPDDMGYKGHQFFSVDMYRDIVKPYHRRAVEWAHAKGIKAHLHSCGDVNPLIPEFIDIGIDALNPLEVKAGMDPLQLKKNYGSDLVLHGGINAVLWDQPDKIREEMQNVIPGMKEGGGYIFSSDHSVPSSVSLEDFRNIVNLAKQLGAYE